MLLYSLIINLNEIRLNHFNIVFKNLWNTHYLFYELIKLFPRFYSLNLKITYSYFILNKLNFKQV